jgi:hypothetical protein
VSALLLGFGVVAGGGLLAASLLLLWRRIRRVRNRQRLVEREQLLTEIRLRQLMQMTVMAMRAELQRGRRDGR